MVTRRTILKGLLGGSVVTVGLPALEVFLNANGTAWADGSLLPRRFGLFFWGNGNTPDKWVPALTGEGEAWALSEQLGGLGSIKEQLAVVTGTAVKVQNRVPHGSGAGGILSAAPLLIEGDGDTFAQPSIDQVIAAELGGETRFRSLEFGVHSDGGRSFNGPHSQNPTEDSPHAMFERVFGAGFTAPGEEPIFDPTIGLRRSVLDAVMQDADRLKARVGTADKARLDQHLDGIRDLERRLARMEENPPDLAACVRPEAPPETFEDIEGRPQMSAMSRAHCDIVAMALACDQTRVFSHWFHHPVGNVLFPGAPDGHHNLTHDEPGDQPWVDAITRMCLDEYRYLVEALRGVQEGDGTLLDNCVVMGTSEISLGRTHSLDEMPILLAGSACGRLKTNIHHRSTTAESSTKVLLTVLRAMGLNRAEYGVDEAKVTDGLGAIEI
jgi:hypothetical protein